MSKAPGWGGGPWALVVELSVLCPWVCFGKSSQIYIMGYGVAGWVTSSKLASSMVAFLGFFFPNLEFHSNHI